MNRTEAVKLCRMIKALCPDQKFDQFTPDAYAIVLDGIRYDQAAAAVKKIYLELGNDESWGTRKIEADDVARAVKRARNDMIGRSISDHTPPPDLSPLEYVAWQRDLARRLGDGEHVIPASIAATAPPRQITAAGRRMADA